jgi:hypothetical protein
MAIKMASKVGVLFDCCFVDCCPGSRRGDMERVVAQWWLPGASSVALDLLLQCIHIMAIEMACNGGTFIWHR